MIKSSGCIDEYISSNSLGGSNFLYVNCKNEDVFSNYKSEWEKNPDQAKNVREFMFGVGEVLSGVFCVSILPYATPVWAVSAAVITDGGRRMFLSLNAEWAEHEKKIIELKKIEQNALDASNN